MGASVLLVPTVSVAEGGGAKVGELVSVDGDKLNVGDKLCVGL